MIYRTGRPGHCGLARRAAGAKLQWKAHIQNEMVSESLGSAWKGKLRKGETGQRREFFIKWIPPLFYSFLFYFSFFFYLLAV